MLKRLKLRLRALFFKSKLEEELDDEVRFHLERSLLFEVSATDPMTFVVSALLLMIVAFLACWIPARRAMRVDPMVALRCD